MPFNVPTAIRMGRPLCLPVWRLLSLYPRAGMEACPYRGGFDIRIAIGNRIPRADTAVRPYAEFVIGTPSGLTAAQFVGEELDRPKSSERRYRNAHPAAREGVAALPYTEFFEYTFICENVLMRKKGTGFVI